MNLFLPYADIQKSVQSLDDKRVIKMCLETAQILSTVVHCTPHEGIYDVYKKTHENHPVVKWVRQHPIHNEFTLNYFIEIGNEYQYRFGKSHKSVEKLLIPLIEFYKEWYINYFTSNKLININFGSIPAMFVNCTDFPELDVHEAYRKCLITKWNHDKIVPKWTKRKTPEFYDIKRNT